MQIPKANTAAVVAAVILVVVGPIFAYKATKWALGKVHPAYASSDGMLAPQGVPLKSSVFEEMKNASRAAVQTTRATSPMSEAFDNGSLPAPLAITEQDPDEAAWALAKKISARDQDSTAALITGLQMSGLDVRAKSGELLRNPITASQGMAFDSWQVAAMAKLYGENWHMSASDLTTVVQKLLPGLGKAPVSDLLLSGIAGSAKGPQPLRFWSRLIIDLGLVSENHYEISTNNPDPASLQLDAIQVALILQRLAGDLRSAAPANVPRVEASADSEPANRRISRPRLVLVGHHSLAYHSQRRARFMRVGESSGGGCVLTDPEGNVLDINAILRTTEWQNLIKIEEQEGGISPAAAANVLMTVLRFYLTFAGLHVDMSIDKDPLVRTQDRDAGDDANLTAHVTFKLDSWDLNCLLPLLRPFMNLANLDVGNFPNTGNVPGVGVTWHLTDGGVNESVIAKDQTSADAYNATAIVQFNPGGGSAGLHTLVNQVTDEDGNAKLPVQGLPQRRDLRVYTPVPINKTFAISVGVKFKGAEANPEAFLAEMIDVLGPALGIASGDVLGGIVGGLTEMLYRMSWAIDGDHTFRLQDWQECDGGWGGTISYETTTHGMGHSSQGDVYNTEATFSTDTVQVQLRGTPSNPPAWSGVSHGSLSETYSSGDLARSTVAGCLVVTETKVQALGQGEIDFAVNSIGNNVFQVTPNSPPSIPGTASKHTTSACPGTVPPDVNSSVQHPAMMSAFQAEGDPQTPGVLRGTTILAQTKISWNLTQCKQ